MKKKSSPKASVTFSRCKSGRIKATHEGSIAEVMHHVHEETVAHCEYCGRKLTRSDVNDYGSLCERCYMQEYY